MSAAAWPRHAAFDTGDLQILFRFLARRKHLLNVFAVLLLLAIYIAGLFTPLPGTSHAVNTMGEKWWFLSFLDRLFTGGALGRGSIFAMGVFAPMVLGGVYRANKVVYFLYVRRALGLAALAAILTVVLRLRGVIGPGSREFAAAFLSLSLGALILRFITVRLTRLRGPAPLYVNLFLILFFDLRAVTSHLLSGHHLLPLALTGVTLIFIAASAFFLLNSKVYITVENVKTASSHRLATIEFAAIDEPLLDAIGQMCVIFYVCLAALLSLLFRWQTITIANYPAFAAVSVGAFAVVWAMMATAVNSPNVTQIMGEAGLWGFTNPRQYALRLVNNFWIIPSQRPGPETEAYIKARMSTALKRSFLVFTSCFAVMIVVQYIVIATGHNVLLFPYGPLVTLFIALMLVANWSMIFRNAWAQVTQFRQQLRGQSRVLAEMYLASPRASSPVALDSESQQYWDEEKVSLQLRNVFESLKLVRDPQFLQSQVRLELKPVAAGESTTLEMRILPAKAKPRKSTVAYLGGIAHKLLEGVILSSVVVLPCVLFLPDLSRKEVGEIVLPILTTSLAQDQLFGLLRRFRLR